MRFLAVNSNDAERYPRDSLEAMRERVARGGLAVSLPPRREPGARRATGPPRTTPHVYVLDADLRVRYEGAPDADHMDPALDAAWLREALDAVLERRRGQPRRDRARRLLDQVEAVT